MMTLLSIQEITESYRVRGIVTQRAGRRRKDRKRYD